MVGTVGTRRALQIFLAEDSFSAQQAQEWGLVAQVVPAAELKAATRKLAGRLAQNSPAAISGTKSLVYQAAVTPIKQQLDAEDRENHRGDENRRIPCRREEIHLQGEIGSSFKIAYRPGLVWLASSRAMRPGRGNEDVDSVF
jgi:enoyl-CoA hydratase/carnithine racemase